MANDRMWLYCEETGLAVLLAKHFGGPWCNKTDDKKLDIFFDACFPYEIEMLCEDNPKKKWFYGPIDEATGLRTIKLENNNDD